MAKINGNTTKLGIFVVTIFIIFTVAIYNIGSKQNMFGATFELSSFFRNVSGLQTGNNVRFSGINVGTIDDIVIINDTTIRVDFRLKKELEGVIKQNATASIGGDGLVGNMVMNITPGKGEADHIEKGGTVPSTDKAKTGDVLSSLGDATENISKLSVILLEAAEKLSHGQGSFPQLLNDPTLANDLQLAARNLLATTQNLNQLSAALNKNMKGVQEGEGVLGYLLTDTTLADQMNQITGGLDNLIRERTEPIMDNLEATSQEMSATSIALRKVVDQIDMENGLVGTILKDSLVSHNFKQTMNHLNESTYRLNENLEAMKHNFLFRKYFKKQEKLKRKENKNAPLSS